MQVTPGSIIKIKHNGAKAQFRILGVGERITKNCFYQCNNMGKFNYNYSLKGFKHKGFIYKSYAVGDPVADHTNRVYLEKLTNI